MTDMWDRVAFGMDQVLMVEETVIKTERLLLPGLGAGAEAEEEALGNKEMKALPAEAEEVMPAEAEEEAAEPIRVEQAGPAVAGCG